MAANEVGPISAKNGVLAALALAGNARESEGDARAGGVCGAEGEAGAVAARVGEGCAEEPARVEDVATCVGETAGGERFEVEVVETTDVDRRRGRRGGRVFSLSTGCGSSTISASESGAGGVADIAEAKDASISSPSS